MRNLFFLLGFLVCKPSFSQTCGQMVSHSVIPSTVYDTTHAYLNLQVYCNEAINLQNYTVTQTGNAFMIDAYYCYGWLQVIQTTNDSIPLGVLPSGTYSYTVNIYNSYGPTTNCMTYITSDQDAGNFIVLPIPNGIEDLQSSNFRIYPNPTSGVINVENAEPGSLLQLYTIEGKQVFSGNINKNSLDLGNAVNAGMYILKIGDSKGQFQSAQLLIVE